MLACHAVRAFLAEAADGEDLDPDDLSFVHAVRVVRVVRRRPGTPTPEAGRGSPASGTCAGKSRKSGSSPAGACAVPAGSSAKRATIPSAGPAPWTGGVTPGSP